MRHINTRLIIEHKHSASHTIQRDRGIYNVVYTEAQVRASAPVWPWP